MSGQRNRKAINNAEPPISSKQTRAQVKRRQLRILLATIAAIAVLAIAGGVLYSQWVAPYRRVVLSVDGNVVRMDYFLRRARYLGDPSTALQQLTYEEIVKIEAKELGINISNLDLNQALLERAAVDNVTASSLNDSAYKTWYREQVDMYDLTDAQFKDMIRTSLMAMRIQDAITQSIGDTAEEVHAHVIVVASQSTAEKVKARLESGEDFGTVAREVSIDSTTKDYGGDIGWIPRGILNDDDTIFALEVGQISDPVPHTSDYGDSYWLYMVSEKDPARVVDAATRQALGSNSFYYWLNAQLEQHTIDYPMTTDTQAWVQWQLSRIK